MSDLESKAKDIRERFAALKKEQPALRARDAATHLGISEGELVAARCSQEVTRLSDDFAAVLEALPAAGPVMVLTRNEHVVHEKVGAFGHVSIGPGHGIVLNHDVDLRLFMGHWHHGFAVSEEVRSGLRRSLQFFDRDGTAVHKVYVRDETDREAFEEIVGGFTSTDQTPGLAPVPLAKPLADRPDGEIDVEGLRASWNALQDTHDFFGMLQEFSVGRHQAMRLAGESLAYRVGPGSCRAMLEGAARDGVPIMCFVGNPGCIQIHTGPVHRIEPRGAWLNVLDEGFNLHLREDRIGSAWVVRKPTRDGDVTSLELFDTDNKPFVQFFGERKPGKEELESWRTLVAGLAREAQPQAMA